MHGKQLLRILLPVLIILGLFFTFQNDILQIINVLFKGGVKDKHVIDLKQFLIPTILTLLILFSFLVTYMNMRNFILRSLSFLSFLFLLKPQLHYWLVDSHAGPGAIYFAATGLPERIFLAEYLLLSLVCSICVYQAWRRYGMCLVHEDSHTSYHFPLFYIGLGWLFGFNVMFPLFIVALISYERTQKPKVSSSPFHGYILISLLCFVQLLITAYLMEDQNILEHIQSSLAGDYFFRSSISLGISCGLYAVTSIIESQKVAPPLKIFVAIFFPISFFYAPAASFALYLHIKEVQYDFTFIDQSFQSLKSTHLLVRSWSLWKVFVALVLLAVDVDLNYRSPGALLLPLPAFFLFSFGVYLLGWGFHMKKYEQWLFQPSRLLATTFSFGVTLATTVLTASRTWEDSDPLKIALLQLEERYSIVIFTIYFFVMFHAFSLIKHRHQVEISWFWLLLPFITTFLVITSRMTARSCTLEKGAEYLPASFNQTIPDYESVIYKIHNDATANGASHAYRGQHARSIGCAFGEFTINEYIPIRYRHGLFTKNGAKFKSIVRFSPGSPTPTSYDSTPDVHGMSMKVFGVEGKRAVEGPNYENHTQDFIFINSPTFFTGDVDSYPSLIRANAQGLGDIITWAFSDPFARVPVLFRVFMMASMSKNMTNPLSESYFSTTPYRLGAETDLAIKYSVVPCHPLDTNRKERELRALHLDKKPVPPYDIAFEPTSNLREYLAYFMNQQLTEEQEDACFVFRVQEQENPCQQPIEDPTIEWKTNWATLATLRIPAQQFRKRDQIEVCENLAFNPWNSLDDHRPLGGINRARKHAYLASGTRRKEINHVPIAEPSFEEWNNTHLPPLPLIDEGRGNTFDFQYQKYPAPFHTLPNFIRTFPMHQQFNLPKLVDLVLTNLQVVTSQFSDVPQTNDHWSSFEDFATLFNTSKRTGKDDAIRAFFKTFSVEHNSEFELQCPPVQHFWQKDSEFARQFIAGVNPMAIHWVSPKDNRPIPSAFDIDDHLTRINQFLAEQQEASFDTLLQDHKLFYVDYEVLEIIIHNRNRIVYPALGLLYLNKNNELMPLAIQLTRRPDAKDYIFLPNERFHVWLFAKMHLASADAQIHEMVSHLAYTHLAMEPIIIAFNRQLPEDHPIFATMEPHFRQTLAINNLGRSTLLRDGGTFDRITSVGLKGSLQLMAEKWKSWDFINNSFPVDLQRRGFYEVTDGKTDNLPGFLYRDDGFKIWNAISRYTMSVVRAHYGKDQAVKADEALQGLISELQDPLRGAHTTIPSISTLEELSQFLSVILWTATAQHSAVNFGQYDYYAFIPNRPLLLTQPMPAPEFHYQVDEQYILSALPTKSETIDTIATSNTLSLSPEQQLYPNLAGSNESFGATLEDPIHLNHFKFHSEYKQFLIELTDIEKELRERNDKLTKAGKMAYPYLEPLRIASSIAI